MSLTLQPNGKFVYRGALTFDPARDQRLVDILQDAQSRGVPLAAVIVDLMRTGLPGQGPVETETDESELIDLSNLSMFDDPEEP